MRPGRAADHSPPSSAAVMEEYSYTSTHPLGHTGPVTGKLYLYIGKSRCCNDGRSVGPSLCVYCCYLIAPFVSTNNSDRYVAAGQQQNYDRMALLNLLKPDGNFTFNIQKILHGAHIACMRSAWMSEHRETSTVYNINRLVL